MPRSITYVGGIYRRQGRWREAVASFERALSLDPRNARIANFAANNHLLCVTGRPLPPVTIARWKSRPMTSIPRSVLLTSKCSKR